MKTSEKLYIESARLEEKASRAALKEARQELSSRLGDLRKRLSKLDRYALTGFGYRLDGIETWLDTREEL